jgi:hypothetical protein
MTALGSVVRLLIVCGALALYDVFIKGLYQQWLASQSMAYGYGESLLGYLAVMLPAYLAAWLLMRTLRRKTR